MDWNDARGFGFVAANTIDGHVFFHIKDFPRNVRGRSRRPAVGDVVVLSIGTDDKGRKRAVTIAFADQQTRSHEDGTGPAAAVAVSIVTGAFVALLGVDIYLGQLPAWVLSIYGLMTPVSIYLYWQDKLAAQQGDWRVSERKLLLVALLGGWVGAAFAQIVLRHKIRKLSFQIPFWTIAAAHYALCLTAGL